MRIVVFLILFSFLFSGSVFAALSISVDGLPAEINIDQEFSGNIFISCSNCSDSYLRGVFFEENSTSYFGYTQNNQAEWVNASNPKTIYYHLDPIESSWSGQLKFKFDSEKNQGKYNFKIIRYTNSGSKSGETEVALIDVKSPSTPTPSGTSTPTFTPTSSPTITITNTPTIKITPTSFPTIKIVTPIEVPTSNEKLPTASVASEILGASVSATPFIEDIVTEVETQTDFFSAVAVGLTSVGLLGVIFYRLRKILNKVGVK